MQVTAYAVQLGASHRESREFALDERLQVRRANPTASPQANPGAPGQQVRLSAAGLNAAHQDRATTSTATTDAAQTPLEPRLALLKQIIERLTGRSLKLLNLSDFAPEAQSASAPSPSTATGLGLSYDLHARYTETESLSFAASGTVVTADGRRLEFQVGLSMERSLSVAVDASLRLGDAHQAKDPLVIDFAGSAAQLTDQRFSFDLNTDGSAESLPMLGGGSGFLVFDRNANGVVDDGSELFGPGSGDGFADLATLDSDGSGWVDEADPAFGQLGIWQPDTQGPGTLSSLAERDLGALYLGRVATPFQIQDGAAQTLGELRSSGIYLKESGGVGSLSQLDLVV